MADRNWLNESKLQLQQRVIALEMELKASKEENAATKDALDRSSADWATNVAAKHTAETERDQALKSLRKYGDHRWKCQVAKYLREYDSTAPSSESPTCDCGWRDVAAALAAGGASLHRCSRCGCPVTDHEVDDEERRECNACECDQYEIPKETR